MCSYYSPSRTHALAKVLLQDRDTRADRRTFQLHTYASKHQPHASATPWHAFCAKTSNKTSQSSDTWQRPLSY